MKRLLRWLRGEEGWSTLILMSVLSVLPSMAFQEAGWLSTGAEDLAKAALAGSWLALVLARSRAPSALAVPACLLLGGAGVFSAVGGAVPPIGTVMDRLEPFWAWLKLAWAGGAAGTDPLSPLLWESAGRLAFLWDRVVTWVNVAVSGGTSSDNLIFLLLIAVLTWAVSFLAGWALYRWHRPLVAALPIGTFVIVDVFLANQGMGYVVVYLGCALLLLLTMNIVRMQGAWQRRGMDYSLELPFDVGFGSSWLVVALVFVALPLPGLTSNPVARAWWNAVSQPWGEVEGTVNRLFAGLNSPNPALGGGTRAGLVLGASFDPQEVAPPFMYVSTDEALPDPRGLQELDQEPVAPAHYWRGIAYDFYSGRGWQNSERTISERRADQPVVVPRPLGFITLTQYFQMLSPRVDMIYAANQPITLSEAYYIQAAGPEDYSALSLSSPPLGSVRYRVVSQIPYLGEEDLRSTSLLYPSWVTERYLQMPKTLPERVVELAGQLTAESATPYDKALAIQGYLRKLPYDPSILLPSGDFDAVDYFLFLQKGYCNYFGTAMAVMLRSVGVPARVVQGYLPGQFSWADRRWVVMENRQHVWTEVYFPPFGWVEFEPTPGQPPILRPPGSLLGGSSGVPPPLPYQPSPSAARNALEQLGAWGSLFVLLFAAAAMAGLVWALYPAWEQRLSPARYAGLVYRRMARFSGWAGQAQRPAQTPGEFASSLAPRLASKEGGLRLLRWRFGVVAPSGSEARQAAEIAATYSKAGYGPRPLEEEDRGPVRLAWQGIEARLRALALGGIGRRKKR